MLLALSFFVSLSLGGKEDSYRFGHKDPKALRGHKGKQESISH